jgi:hypothetical protein
LTGHLERSLPTLVFVHGRGQQGREPDALWQRWAVGLNNGPGRGDRRDAPAGFGQADLALAWVNVHDLRDWATLGSPLPPGGAWSRFPVGQEHLLAATC